MAWLASKLLAYVKTQYGAMKPAEKDKFRTSLRTWLNKLEAS